MSLISSPADFEVIFCGKTAGIAVAYVEDFCVKKRPKAAEVISEIYGTDN
jgi:hypothetical protein